MSRVIVKNLPKQVKEEQVRKHFEAFGPITDLQLKYTKDGIFRRFCFVGYLNDEQAQRAIDKLNKTYIGTAKIVVEQCYNLNDSNRPRPWSKYSPQVQEPVKKPIDEKKIKTKKQGNSQLVDAILGDLKYDEKFKEFVKNVDSMRNSEQIIWNDTMQNTDEEPKQSSKAIKEQEPIRSSSPVQEEKVLAPRYFVQIRGIPYSSKERDIRQFFSPISILHCRLIHNRKTNALTGVCWIELENENDMNKAMLKQKSILSIEKTGEHRYLELSSHIKNQHLINKSTTNHKKPLKAYEPIPESIGETGELFVRNLSYRTTEQDLESLFNPFGQITNINMPIDSLTKQPKGFAHVTFMFPEHALRAFNELDGHAFQGRLLHILPGKTQQQQQQPDSSESTNNQTPTSIATSSEQNWNTLFLSSNVIAEIMAERYGLDKSSVASSTKKNESLAVRLAVGETQIIHETRQFLLDNGVQLDAFSQAMPSTKRSKTVILAKNLPIKTHDQDLRILFEKYGKLERIILPPYGHCALIVFEHAQEARQAFKQLSYRKFKDNKPLYLEWAPGNALSSHVKHDVKPIESSTDVQEPTITIAEEKEEEEQPQEEETFTLFVKNLNFDTTDTDLENHFSSIGSCRAYVAKKKDPKRSGHMLSMGYGFVEFPSLKLLNEALKQLQHSQLQGHDLELKRSERTMKSTLPANSTKRKRQTEKEQHTSKILVKNIPFQANIREIRELFRVFGELKFVRMPKKIDDEHHRGFGFVDFVSKNDAKNAFEALCHSTHLYGRRLVLEWADEENDTVEGLRKKTAAEFNLNSTDKRVKRSELLGDLRKMGGNDQTPLKKTTEDDDDDNDE
ncbi:hypothetical protein I4U23_026160 [Adineta vaga]|nr:hypothetical protein I4U23_026160 [Adineta vaga]